MSTKLEQVLELGDFRSLKSIYYTNVGSLTSCLKIIHKYKLKRDSCTEGSVLERLKDLRQVEDTEHVIKFLRTWDESYEGEDEIPEVFLSLGFFRQPKSRFTFILTELLQGKDLMDFLLADYYEAAKGCQLARSAENELKKSEIIKSCKRCFFQAAKGLAFLHCDRVRIVHRDIKPGNIMLHATGPGTYIAKIIDFGTAIFLTDEEDKLKKRKQQEAKKKKLNNTRKSQNDLQNKLMAGAAAFRSPEMVKQGKYSDKIVFNETTDVYSLGMVYFCIVSPPLERDNKYQGRESISKQENINVYTENVKKLYHELYEVPNAGQGMWTFRGLDMNLIQTKFFSRHDLTDGDCKLLNKMLCPKERRITSSELVATLQTQWKLF